jgi:hypothetical protein
MAWYGSGAPDEKTHCPGQEYSSGKEMKPKIVAFEPRWCYTYGLHCMAFEASESKHGDMDTQVFLQNVQQPL